MPRFIWLAILLPVLASCKPRQTESQVKVDEAPAPKADGGLGADIEKRCARVLVNLVKETACSFDLCTFQASQDPLPSYKVLESGMLNEDAGRGRKILNVRDVTDALMLPSPSLSSLYRCNLGLAGPSSSQQFVRILDRARRALELLNDQREYYVLPNVTLTGRSLPSYPLLVWMLATQELATVPINEMNFLGAPAAFKAHFERTILGRMGFTEEDLMLAETLVHTDRDLTELHKGSVTAESLRTSVAQAAEQANLSVKDYWSMLRLLHVARMGSFAWARPRLFQLKTAQGYQSPPTLLNETDVIPASGGQLTTSPIERLNTEFQAN